MASRTNLDPATKEALYNLLTGLHEGLLALKQALDPPTEQKLERVDGGAKRRTKPRGQLASVRKDGDDA